TRMLVAVGILEYSGHLSARLPEGDTFLIQPGNDARATVAPDRLLTVDLDGRVVEGEAKAPSEVAIHAEIYRQRPDAGAVAHFHHDPTTMFSMVGERPLVPVKNHAARWAAGVPVYPHPWHVDTQEKGKALAHQLGAGHAILLRAHGQVVVAEDVKTLFADVVHFVENADALARAHALGPVVPLTDEECGQFLETFNRASHARKLWRYYTTVHGREA
ncbi:MAG TPA: class II aldolase/adducin family protein, partial [Acidimicrobiales bacterium]|nr:class II aldolase/adducin family protein [Acidimicrobiales bacterium]